MAFSYIRRAETGQLFMLSSGEIATARRVCTYVHVMIETEEGEHPGCIDAWSERPFSYVYREGYSRCLRFAATGEKNFGLYIRWRSGHYPYPEISKMHVWAFGIDLGKTDFPRSPDSYKKVAAISVADNGHVFVNGADTGVWPWP